MPFGNQVIFYSWFTVTENSFQNSEVVLSTAWKSIMLVWAVLFYSASLTWVSSMYVGLQTLAPLPESWQHQRGREGQRQSAVWFGQHHQLRPAEQDGQAEARKPFQCSHHGQLCGWTVYYFDMLPESLFTSFSRLNDISNNFALWCNYVVKGIGFFWLFFFVILCRMSPIFWRT